MSGRADLAFVNGRIYTVDSQDAFVEAIAIRDGRVVATGRQVNDIKDFLDSATDVVDLKGFAIVPGLFDGHCHLGPFGMYSVAVDCRSSVVESIGDILELVSKRVRTTPPGSWIRGRGYDHTKLIEKRHPNRAELDAVAPEHPVVLTRVCGHYSAFNTKAMELAGFDEQTPEPPSGHWDRVDGRLVGLARETAQKPLLNASRLTDEEMKDALAYAQSRFLSVGCTSVHDAGGLLGDWMRNLMALDRAGDWSLRVYAFAAVGAEGADEEAAYGALRMGGGSGFGNDRVRIGAFKLMTDGSSSGPSAATREPYDVDPSDQGVLIWAQDELNDKIAYAHESGSQVAMHAVGDRAIECALSAYDALGDWDSQVRRHRIEHCAMLPDDLQERVANSGVIPVMQPVFLYEFGDGYIASYGRQRANSMFPTASLMRRGVPVVDSSDAPVTDHRPLFGMQMAMTRLTQGGEVLGPEHRATFGQALRMRTINAAYASFDEGRLGSLEPGKRADLVVLPEDPAATDATDLGYLEPALTMIDGRVVYEAANGGL